MITLTHYADIQPENSRRPATEHITIGNDYLSGRIIGQALIGLDDTDALRSIRESVLAERITAGEIAEIIGAVGAESREAAEYLASAVEDADALSGSEILDSRRDWLLSMAQSITADVLAAPSWTIAPAGVVKCDHWADQRGTVSALGDPDLIMQVISIECGDYGPAMIRALMAIAETHRDVAVSAAKHWDSAIAELVQHADPRDYRDIDGAHCQAAGSDSAPLPGRYTIGVGGHAGKDDAYAEWLAAQPGVTVGRREGEGDAYFGSLQSTATRRAWAAYAAA